MKIIITESQFNNLIPHSLRRRLGEMDLDRIDDIIDSNLRFWIGAAKDTDEFVREIIKDSLNEFVTEYKLDEYVNYDREDDEEEYYEEKENKIYQIFWELIPFLEMTYRNQLSDYYKKHKK